MNTDGKPMGEVTSPRLITTLFIPGLSLEDRKLPWMLWTSHRTRSLSHRPVAGARKRKAALKYAARQHRVVTRYL